MGYPDRDHRQGANTFFRKKKQGVVTFFSKNIRGAKRFFSRKKVEGGGRRLFCEKKNIYIKINQINQSLKYTIITVSRHFRRSSPVILRPSKKSVKKSVIFARLKCF